MDIGRPSLPSSSPSRHRPLGPIAVLAGGTEEMMQPLMIEAITVGGSL